jgi:hypothetical protein
MNSRLRTRIGLLTAVSILGLAGGLLSLAAAVPASAATSHVAAPAAATAPIRASASSAAEPLRADALSPAADGCAIETGWFRSYYDGCAHWAKYVCVALHHFNLSPTPSYVSDGCLQAVDLFSGENETGKSICIPGMSASGYLHTAWHSFEITGQPVC